MFGSPDDSPASARYDLLLANSLPILAIAGFTLLLFSRLLFTNQVLASGDILHYFYPYRDFAANAFRMGEIPLWNPYIFMGVPFLANPQAAVLYPLHWPLSWLPVTKQIYWSAAIHTWLLGVGGYFLMRQMHNSRWAGLVTGLILAGSGFYGGMIGHINQMNAAAWLPWSILVLERARVGQARWSVSIGWLGICTALMLLAGHTQTAYINLFGLGLWLIGPVILDGLTAIVPSRASILVSRTPQAENAHRFNLVQRLTIYAGGVLLGVILSMAQLLPTLELSQLGLRQGGLTYADATSFSLNLSKLPFTLLPTYGFVDLSVTYGTLGFSEFMAYIGIVGLVLAFIGFWYERSIIRLLALWLVMAGLFLAVGRWNPFYWVLYKIVPGFDLFRTPARWMMLYTMGIALLAGCGFDYGRQRWARRLGEKRVLATHALSIAVLLIVGGELLFAARSLPHTHTTALAAVTDFRTAVAHLLTEPQRYAVAPAASGRFLSMSTITFDPGDMEAYRQILTGGQFPQLDERAIAQLIVALKSQEILAPNLPMMWRIPSVDGFDGGVLPLQRYIRALSLFIADDQIVPDGRLREQVKLVPSAALLGLFNVQHVITDKVQDLWYKGIYYDRQIGAHLGMTVDKPNAVILAVPYSFEATRLDLVGAMANAEPVLEQLVGQSITAAEVHIVGRVGGDSPDIDESMRSYTLHVGGETGAHWADEQIDSPLATASGAEVAYQDVDGGRQEYLASLQFGEPIAPTKIRIELTSEFGALSDMASLRLQAATLVDERTGMFLPLLPSDKGLFALQHSGDVKVYKNVDTIPRAYLVYNVISATDPLNALEIVGERLAKSHQLSIPNQPKRTIDLTEKPEVEQPLPWAVVEGLASFKSDPTETDGVGILTYETSRVEISVQSGSDAFLVLSDSYYPGWQAQIDGVPAQIYPTNGLFRGVLIPSGSHTITFEYKPMQWRYGLLGSFIGSMLLLVCFVGRRR